MRGPVSSRQFPLLPPVLCYPHIQSFPGRRGGGVEMGFGDRETLPGLLLLEARPHGEPLRPQPAATTQPGVTTPSGDSSPSPRATRLKPTGAEMSGLCQALPNCTFGHTRSVAVSRRGVVCHTAIEGAFICGGSHRQRAEMWKPGLRPGPPVLPGPSPPR